MEISKDKEVIDERLEAQAGFTEVTQRIPTRRSRLHNFSFPTTIMNWGCQRILLCVNSVSGIDSLAPRSMTQDTQKEPQREMNASYFPIDSVHMSSQVGGFKEKEEQKNASSVAAEGAATAKAIPWNLRKRRPTCYAAPDKGSKRYRSSTLSKPLLRNDDPGKALMQGTTVGKNSQRKEFSISLSRKEIEEDFYTFTGAKPNRKPKKRPKAVQKKLDALFPGFWLSEIREDRYKVIE